MGRPVASRAPSDPAGSGGSSCTSRASGLAGWRLCAALLAFSILPITAFAQSPGSNAGAQGADKPKMLVEADQLVQNSDDNTVSAVGNARIYYKGKTLEADKVIYNKTTKRLFAVGHAKLTEQDGTVYHGDTFDLTDDFREGFVNSLRADTPPGPTATHYSAPRMERVGGDTTVFTKGTYTACESCKDNPSKPTLWRVRAQRIIHKGDEQMVYYEDAYLEFLGIPVAYVPYMSAPDPTVKKKSGVLTPSTFYRTGLGYGVGVPIFYNLAPDYDLTFTPTLFSTQGFFGAGEFRQTFSNGLYYIRASGIDELKPNAFAAAPYGAGGYRFRYDVATKGEFQINENWKFGWNIAVLSDKYYLTDYAIPADSLSSNYFSESTSTIYLTGQGERSFFDLRGYYIEGLAAQDIQAQQPLARPVLDYNRTFDIDPAKTHGIGGQVEADFNLTSLSASSASFQAVGPRTLDAAYGLYNVCNTYLPGTTSGSSCLLRGIGGDYTRVSGQLSYERKFVDSIGEVWTPFAFARVNGEMLNLNTSGVYTFSNGSATSSYSNASQSAFLPSGSGTTGYVVPGVGVEYRYPFMTTVPFGSVVLEPIAQVIARPDSVLGTTSLVNLDAQSLVFDSSNLFDWSKFSGYDRFETGVRANYGGQFSLNLKNGGYAHVILGQSAQLAGTNSYATADAANVGLSSGLDTQRSDYVAGATFSPARFISIGGQGRFDVTTLENRRVDATMNLNFGKLTGAVQFANYQSQPLIGYDVRREGLALSGRYDFIDHYFVNGNITFDMSRHLYPASVIGASNPGPYAIAGMGLGIGYADDCTTFMLNYSSVYQQNAYGVYAPNDTYLVTLQLRTLGDASFSRTTQNTSQNLDAVH
jgi:LPS-assembly protein